MKKTTKENPLTFFRKANEAREATVKKSLKKETRKTVIKKIEVKLKKLQKQL